MEDNVSTTGGYPWVPTDPSETKCNYFIKNSSIPFHLSNPYGGIPQNLLINVLGWILCFGFFGILRRVAGNYGRLALMRNAPSGSPWTRVFYSVEEDKGIFSWIKSIFTLSDEKYRVKCGYDAVQYLTFQRHLILFLTIITLVCIGVILPINFQGDLQGTTEDFGHTTISNLNGEDPRLWVHIIISILFLPLGVFIMRRFSVTLEIKEDECISSRTLMLAKVPRSYCTKEFLARYFSEIYDTFEIEDIQIAYDVSKLKTLADKWDRARKAKMYCESNDVELQMKPHRCGIMCTCCGNTVKALDFYSEEERKYAGLLARVKVRVKNGSIGVAFVTFKKLDDAQKVCEDFTKILGGLFFSAERPSSSLETELKPWKWTVRFAPPPDDIYWENLDYDSHRLFVVKTVLVNFILFVVLFFFTSPAYILSEIKLFFKAIFSFDIIHLPDKINDFIPTLMLWTLTALLPNIVAYSDWLMGHWRRSVENIWIMRKVFFYLLFMVLILPSVGLTSLLAFAEMVIHNNDDEDHKFKWNCIFLPDNGAFFVNYVITSALVGTGLELIRFSELFLYACRMCFARSVAETPSVRKANLYEFPFGFNYGWMLLIFAMTTAYAVVCPLITPFGLFYMIMKHGVDRYNIYYAYKPSKINKNIHSTAVNCVIMSLLIQQLILFFFNVIRTGNDDGILSPRAIFLLSTITIFCLIFIVNIFFHVFKGVSPIQYIPQKNGVGGNKNNEDINLEKSDTYYPRNSKFIPDILRSDSHRSPLEEMNVNSNPLDDDHEDEINTVEVHDSPTYGSIENRSEVTYSTPSSGVYQ